MYRRFTEAEDDFIRANYGKMQNKQIAEALGRPRGSIGSRVCRLRKMGESYKPKKKQTEKTLCWECRRATNPDGKCSWAAKLKPVDGWEAIRSDVRQIIDGKAQYMESYAVVKCPLFMEDERKE